MPRLACKKDANHDELVQAHRQLGWWIEDTWQVAQYIAGFPDAMGMHPKTGRVVFLEFKVSHARLTKAEQAWHERCPLPVVVERTVEDVLFTHQAYGGLRDPG